VTFVVVNNREYNILKKYMASQPQSASVRANRFIAMDIVDPAIDFLALAASMGVPARRVERAADIAPAIEAGKRRTTGGRYPGSKSVIPRSRYDDSLAARISGPCRWVYAAAVRKSRRDGESCILPTDLPGSG